MNASEDGSATETARQRGDYSRGAASSGPLVALSLERGWAYADDFAGVRDDAQTRRPKTVGPTFALADFGAEPSLIVIDAFLRAEALDRPTVSHKAELAMAARAVVLHSLFFEWHRSSLLGLLSITIAVKRRLLATCIGPMLPDLDFVSCVSDHAPTLTADCGPHSRGCVGPSRARGAGVRIRRTAGQSARTASLTGGHYELGWQAWSIQTIQKP